MAFDLEQFKKTLLYEVRAPATDVFADLDSLREVDKHNEGIAKRFLQAGCVTLLLGIVCFVVGVVTELPPLFAVAGLAIVAGIVSFVVRRRYSRLDTEDRRYQLVEKVVRLLSADLHPEQELGLRLDLSKPKQKHKLQGEGEVGQWKVEYYEDPWLELKTRLLDGTACQLRLTEHFQYRHRWARSSSGKRKHKSKTKSATRALLELKVKEHKFPGLSQLAGTAQQAVQLPPAVALKSLRVEPPHLAMQVATKEEWGVGTPEKPLQPPVTEGSEIVALMFMSLYQVLNLARKMEATA
jgi:hypothetical protein